jgi:dephospho-CoA kinase
MNKPEKKFITIGLTGGYGSGKSFVGGMCQRRGCYVIDADDIAREAVRPKTAVWKRLVARFGEKILNRDGTIDRKTLAGIVFGRARELAHLNAVVHPAVIREIKKKLVEHRRTGTGGIVVVSAPLLVEAGLVHMFDVLIVVKIKKEVQIKRCRKSKDETVREIKKRIAAQMPQSRKLRYADYVVDNNGSPRQTEKQVITILNTIQTGNRRQ